MFCDDRVRSFISIGSQINYGGSVLYQLLRNVDIRTETNDSQKLLLDGADIVASGVKFFST
jgi:hypothetical protein